MAGDFVNMNAAETLACFENVLKLNENTRNDVIATGVTVMGDLANRHETEHKSFENSLKGQNIVIQPVPLSNLRLSGELIRIWNTCDVF